MIKILNEAQATSQDLYIEFGKRHPNSYLGLDIIYRNRQRIGKDTIKTLLSHISRELKSTTRAQALYIFLNDELAGKGKRFIDFDAKTLNGKIKTLYDVQAIPTSFLINKEGLIVEKFIGYDDETFLNRLEKLIDEK